MPQKTRIISLNTAQTLKLEGCLAVCLFILHTTHGLDLDTCKDAHGMETHQIPASALSASSRLHPSVSAQQARIRDESGGGAWCPEGQVSRDSLEYLQIDLGRLKVVTKVETQGRFGEGQGHEFAEQYLLEFLREEGGPWIQFRNRHGQGVLQGNTNTYAPEIRDVDPPIIARWVRFIPYNPYPKTVCMRVELYGCNWTDHLVSYSMPQGQRLEKGLDLYDFIYDGLIDDEQMTGGLGQLTDGQKGDHKFWTEHWHMKIKGYEWVGWRNESEAENRPIRIDCKFDSVRNFNVVFLHANNVFRKGVRVFRTAKIYFSIGGVYYNEPPITYNYLRDTEFPTERDVEIRLQNRIGQFVRIELYFDDTWLQLSEIQFVSEPAIGVIQPETKPVLRTTTPETNTNRGRTPSHGNSEEFPGSSRENANSETPSGKNKNNFLNNEETYIVDTPHNGKMKDEEIIGIILGILAVLIILFLVILIVLCLRHKRQKYNNNHRAMKTMGDSFGDSYNASDVMVGISNGMPINTYKLVPSHDVDGESKGSPTCVNLTNADFLGGLEMQGRRLPELPPKTPESTISGTHTGRSSQDYAIPDYAEPPKPALVIQIPPLTPRPRGNTLTNAVETAELPPEITETGTIPLHYASSTLPPLQGVSGNTLYAAPQLALTQPGWWQPVTNIIEFPRENLKPIEKLGEGQFGEVQLCEATCMGDLLGDDFLLNRMTSRSMLVAVKMLRPNADPQARLDFEKELQILAQLRDPNIVQVLGVCTRTPPLAVVVEYMKHGDLYQYLRQHELETGVTLRRGVGANSMDPISYGCLIYMVTQVASGMKYLEGQHLVHRDLATRNCLVGAHYTIKISDFGMSRPLYSSDYYRLEGRAVLPIRWMAWESVLLGKFSPKSDVWSFGVTMWEILTLVRTQPYASLSDDDVIANCSHIYAGDPCAVYLPQPLHCPKEIFDLVRECWNADAHSRPSFREIHMFLQRKNMGYNPREDRCAMIGGLAGNGLNPSCSAFASLPASFV